MVSETGEKERLYKACSAWYNRPAGEFALQKLNEKIAENISDVFGYHAFETGALLDQCRFLEASRVDTCFAVGREDEDVSLQAEMEALPLDFDSVDLVIASHVLECSDNPHQVLREIDRVLVADGHCIFIGFNPLAFWHSGRSFCASSDTHRRPHLYGVSRVRDWLSLLGWNVKKISYVSFRPSFLKGKLFTRMEKMEKWGSLYWPIFGNLYIIHAQKQVVMMRPKKREWDPSAVLPPKVAINTSPRSTQIRDKK